MHINCLKIKLLKCKNTKKKSWSTVVKKKKNQLNNSYYQPELIGFKDSPVNHSRNQFVNYQNNNCSEIMTNRGMWISI